MKNVLDAIDKKNKLKKNNIKAQLVPFFSVLIILFLIFFSQYSKKSEVKPNINSEKNNFEEQKLYPKGGPVKLAGEADTQVEAQKGEEPVETEKETDKKEAPRDDLIIGIIADAHSGQENGFSRLNSASWALKNYFAPDIAVDLGDLIESRFYYKAIKKSAAIADYKSASYLISRYFPVYHAIGNHEVLSLSKADIQNLTGRRNYFAVRVKGYNIIILDSNYNKNGDNVDAKHADDFLYDGALPEKELDWLENQVKNNNNNIIFVHHPFYELTNRGKVEDIIEKNRKRIIMIANGHKHPKTLGVRTFGGVKLYEIPSDFYQKTYAVVRINGFQVSVSVRKVN